MPSGNDLLAAARSFGSQTYRLEPPPSLADGTIDCSLMVQAAAQKIGLTGVPRTAEQQRQYATPVAWADVQPGDLLLFERTYDTPGASHVGLSLGKGTQKMIDARDRGPGVPAVGVTDIRSDYWQSRIMSAGRLPGLTDAAPLPDDADRLFTFEQLWPAIKVAGDEFGYDPRKLAGMVKQESGFRNWRVHQDGTGHGLLGLDDNGLLPDFEQWSGLSVGRGHGAAGIPIVPQLRYAAMALARYARQFGDEWAAPRAWHRGTRLMNDARGQNYEQLIRAHVTTLFANGEPSVPDPEPEAPASPTFSVGPGILQAMAERGDAPGSDEMFTKRGDRDEWSEAYGTSGRRYIWLPSVSRIFVYEPAA